MPDSVAAAPASAGRKKDRGESRTELCAMPAPSRRRLSLSNGLWRCQPSSAGKAGPPASLDGRAPLHRHELVAAAALRDEAVRRERRVIERDPAALGRGHVEELLA